MCVNLRSTSANRKQDSELTLKVYSLKKLTLVLVVSVVSDTVKHLMLNTDLSYY